MNTPLTAEQVRERLVSLREHDLPPTHGAGPSPMSTTRGARRWTSSPGRRSRHTGVERAGPDRVPFARGDGAREVVGFAAGLLDAPGVCRDGHQRGHRVVPARRLAARDARPEVARPQIVAPTTIHAAFHKAAHLFGLELTLVDVDPSPTAPIPRRWRRR